MVVAHRRSISPKVFEVPSNVLFALLPARTWELNLLAIEAATNFTNFYPFISPLAWKRRCEFEG